MVITSFSFGWSEYSISRLALQDAKQAAALWRQPVWKLGFLDDQHTAGGQGIGSSSFANGLNGYTGRSVDLVGIDLAHQGDGGLIGSRPGAFAVKVEKFKTPVSNA